MCCTGLGGGWGHVLHWTRGWLGACAALDWGVAGGMCCTGLGGGWGHVLHWTRGWLGACAALD